MSCLYAPFQLAVLSRLSYLLIRSSWARLSEALHRSTSFIPGACYQGTKCLGRNLKLPRADAHVQMSPYASSTVTSWLHVHCTNLRRRISVGLLYARDCLGRHYGACRRNPDYRALDLPNPTYPQRVSLLSPATGQNSDTDQGKRRRIGESDDYCSMGKPIMQKKRRPPKEVAVSP
ncbi:hypothetical protein OF83DRAFT_743162 [Amylostereum chailletii]|nr:hypothetical protein OF83DRAFT_743162 [Amylostereum chailletii]